MVGMSEFIGPESEATDMEILGLISDQHLDELTNELLARDDVLADPEIAGRC